MAVSLKDSDDDLDDLDEQADINITPFIDVILVLLIIFMVAAPLSTVDVLVNLPVATAKPEPRPEKPTFISLKSDLTLAVGEAAVPHTGLIAAVDDATKTNHDARLFLRADKSVSYGVILTLLDQLRAAGYLKVGLVALDGSAAPPATAAPATVREGSAP